MPELTIAHGALLASLFAVGAVVGWIARSDRCAREKIAANAGWQEQLEGQQADNRRLEQQNRKLMRRLREFQASHKDSQQRTRELTATLKQSIDRSDELNREISDVRSDLQLAIKERNRLQSEARDRSIRDEAAASAMRDKDRKIFKLSRELTSWQSRLPPLVEKFRQRDSEAQELRARLREAEERIAELDALPASNNTRIEPLGPGSLTAGLNASNDQYDCASAHGVPGPTTRFGSGLYRRDSGREEQERPHEGSGGPPQAARPGRPEIIVGMPPSVLRDDLQRIKGVGPAIEQALNDFGIFRFAQIADISEYDIDRIAERLKGFRSRIYREDWIGQARALRYRS